jgi:hypothetical protein
MPARKILVGTVKAMCAGSLQNAVVAIEHCRDKKDFRSIS